MVDPGMSEDLSFRAPKRSTKARSAQLHDTYKAAQCAIYGSDESSCEQSAGAGVGMRRKSFFDSNALTSGIKS